MRLYEYLVEKLQLDEDVAVDFNEYLRELVDRWGTQYCENLTGEDEVEPREIRQEFLAFVGVEDVIEFFECNYETIAPKVKKKITVNEAESFIELALATYDDLLDGFIEEIYYHACTTIDSLKCAYEEDYDLCKEEEEYEGYIIEED